MAIQKLYAGAKLRELRTRLTLTQRDFAGKLGVSLPYLNQMENNHRPVSASVVLALAQEFGLDVTELTVGEGCTEANCQAPGCDVCRSFGQFAACREWTCDAALYGEGTADSCDCGCGAPDPDWTTTAAPRPAATTRRASAVTTPTVER